MRFEGYTTVPEGDSAMLLVTPTTDVATAGVCVGVGLLTGEVVLADCPWTAATQILPLPLLLLPASGSNLPLSIQVLIISICFFVKIWS